MEEIPIYDQLTKDALYLIAVEMDMPDLIAFCLSDRTLNKRICDDNRFWLFKLRHDFDFDEVIDRDRAKEYYKFLHKNRDKTLNQKLVEAIKEGNLVIVKYLIDMGADIDVQNDDALSWASIYGHLTIVKYLIDAGADIHAWDNKALMFASENGHVEVVGLLLDHGADIHARNNYALRVASGNGHVEVVRLLLDRGVDIRNNYGRALRWAREKGHTEVVNLLQSRM